VLPIPVPPLRRTPLTQNTFLKDERNMTAFTMRSSVFAVLLSSTLVSIGATAQVQAQPASSTPAAKPFQSYSEIVAAAPPDAWRAPDPQNVIYVEIASGRVVIELAPNVAPNHVANIRALIREQYFDGLPIKRSQDNYVVQWGTPDGQQPRAKKAAKSNLQPEFVRKLSGSEFNAFAFDRLPDIDGYAPQVGFASGFHAGRDPKASEVWLAHCYGAVGVGRGNALDSAAGEELYVVTGHAPRHLDKNITLVGRVLQGMPLLSSLPRVTGPLGFYDKPSLYTPIKSIRVAADVAPAERTNLEVIRTDTPTFQRAVEALRNRGGDWFKVPAGHVELCNVPIAVRIPPAVPPVPVMK
jgi:cyclophilin family peptidyl-prolyl cis-trans isomerase